ncbi:MAG: hypothetical protein AB8G86_24410 [Saprospiraceae bacterium]
MKVANPIYDTVFKYLLEDTEIARRLLSEIIGEEITKIELRPQEHTYKTEKHDITILRFDFKATIQLKAQLTKGSKKKNWTPKYKTVLIELQKAKKPKDIERFRRYLGDNYKKKDTITDATGEVQAVDLPIVTIYFLGHSLPPISTSVLKINRVYIDLNTNETLAVKTEFIEKLTHDCYAILINKLSKESRSTLEQILQIFNQTYILDSDKKFLEINEQLLKSNDLLQLMSGRLREAATDEQVIEGILIEQEVEEVIDQHIREKEALKEENEGLKGENEDLKEGVKERDEKLKDQERLIEELKKRLKNQK